MGVECIICFSPFPQNQSPSREIAEERDLVFNKILKILKVNLSPFRWNFEMESFPFCERCTEDVRQQIWFHDRLIEIQAGIKNGKAEIQRKIRESDSARQLPPTDVKVIIFRGQVLSNLSSGNEDLRAETIVGLPPPLLDPSSNSSIPLGVFASSGTQEVHSSLQPSSSNSNNNRAPVNFDSTAFSFYSPSKSQGFYHQPYQVENVPLPTGPPANIIYNSHNIDQQTINNPSSMFVVGDDLGVSNYENHVASNETVPLHYLSKCDVVDDGYDRTGGSGVVSKLTKTSRSKRKAEKRKGSNSRTSPSTPPKTKRTENKSPDPEYSPGWNDFDNQSADSDSSFPEERECKPKLKTTIGGQNSSIFYHKDKPKRDRKKNSANVQSKSKRNRIPKQATRLSMNPHPIVTDSDGRQFIQDIEIIVLKDGFGCGACDFKITRESRNCRLKLREHIRGLHLNAFHCNVCDKPFKTSSHLRLHNTRMHVHEKTECPDCFRPIGLENLKVHQFTHKNDEEKAQAEAAGLKPKPRHTKPVGGTICVFCGRTFSSIFSLRRHEELHSAPPEKRKNISCPNCQRKFSQQKNLGIHLTRHCKNVGDDQIKQEKHFACHLCDTKCYTKTHLTAHKLTHVQKEERDFQCPICARKISSQKFYDEHAVAHIKREEVKEDFKYPCNICGLKFKIRKNAVRHMRDNQACSKIFKQVKALSSEYNILPEFPDQDEAPNSDIEEEYSTVIGNTVAGLTDANKITHQEFKKTKDGQLTFRGIKITPICGGYTCGQCDKDIVHHRLPKRMIREHINGYHFGSYRCQHCNVYYRSRGALTQHFSCSHGTITCGICGMEGLGKWTKVSHSWSHKSEEEKQEIINSNEPWKIPFTIRSDLGIKGFVSWSCSSCPEIFSSRSELASHQQQEHNLGTPKASKHKRTRRKPCPKSKIQPPNSTNSDSEDVDNYQFQDFPSSGISEHQRSSRLALRSRNTRFKSITKFQNPCLDREYLRTSVPIPRLPDVILQGKNFVCLGDNRLSFTTKVGTNRQLLLDNDDDEDIDVKLLFEPESD